MLATPAACEALMTSSTSVARGALMTSSTPAAREALMTSSTPSAREALMGREIGTNEMHPTSGKHSRALLDDVIKQWLS